MEKQLENIQLDTFEKKLLEKDIPIKIGNLIGKGGQKHVYAAQITNSGKKVVLYPPN